MILTGLGYFGPIYCEREVVRGTCENLDFLDVKGQANESDLQIYEANLPLNDIKLL